MERHREGRGGVAEHGRRGAGREQERLRAPRGDLRVARLPRALLDVPGREPSRPTPATKQRRSEWNQMKPSLGNAQRRNLFRRRSAGLILSTARVHASVV